MTRSRQILTLCACGLLSSVWAVLPVRADNAGDGAAADSLVSSQPDSVAVDSLQMYMSSAGVHPRLKSDTKSTAQRVNLKNSMEMNIAYPNLWTVGGKVYYEREIPRELKRSVSRKGFNISTSQRVLGHFPLSLSVDRKRNRQEQNPGESNYIRQDWDISTISVSGSGKTEFGSWLMANMQTGVAVNRTLNTSNQGLNREVSDGTRNISGQVELKPQRDLKIKADYAGNVNDGVSELLDLSDNVRGVTSALNMNLDYNWDRKVVVKVVGGQSDQASERLDFQRDLFNVVLPDSVPIKERTLTRKYNGEVSLQIKPSLRFDFNLKMSRSVETKRLNTTDTKDRDTETDNLNLSLNIKPWKSNDVSASYKEKTSHTLDYSADRKAVTRELLFKSTQRLNPSFSLGGEAWFMLSQDFYANAVKNPLDRDQAQSRVMLTVKGNVLSWLSGDSTIRYSENRSLYVHSSKSISNKSRINLSWRSKLNYKFWKLYQVTQTYEISASQDDFTFNAGQNALDREYRLNTSSSVPIYGSLTLDFNHEFSLKQMGSYLPDPDVTGSPLTFFLDSRLKRENLKLALSYTFLGYLKVACRQELGREVNYSYESRAQTLSPFGSLSLSLNLDRPLGDSGKIRFDLEHRRRSGRFVRENQRSLWIPSLMLNYDF